MNYHSDINKLKTDILLYHHNGFWFHFPYIASRLSVSLHSQYYDVILLSRRGPPPPEQIVITPNAPAMETMAAQLTEDNEDFADRGRYHQSEIVKGNNFQDYDSE